MPTRKFSPAETEFMGFGTWLKGTQGNNLYICCPQCGTPQLLSATSAISASGLVTPALKCANTFCSFEEEIELIGWLPPALPE